jgi:hypothetical protein
MGASSFPTQDALQEEPCASQRNCRQHQQALFYAALVLLATGLVTLYFGFTVVAVAVLAMGAFFGQGSCNYELKEDLMKEQHYLARFIAAQLTSDLAAIRSERQKENHEEDQP